MFRFLLMLDSSKEVLISESLPTSVFLRVFDCISHSGAELDNNLITERPFNTPHQPHTLLYSLTNPQNNTYPCVIHMQQIVYLM